MSDAHPHSDSDTAATQDCSHTQPKTKPISMHEGVPHWHDVCCCEAEPRWVAIAEELGIDLDAGWTSEDEQPQSEP